MFVFTEFQIHSTSTSLVASSTTSPDGGGAYPVGSTETGITPDMANNKRPRSFLVQLLFFTNRFRIKSQLRVRLEVSEFASIADLRCEMFWRARRDLRAVRRSLLLSREELGLAGVVA